MQVLMQIPRQFRLPLTATVLVAGLLMGSLTATRAQSTLFTNSNTILTSGPSTVVPPPGGSVTRLFGSGDSYFINSAGTTDSSLKDGGQGIGADIRLSVAGNGIRLISHQNAIVNVGNDIYTFYTTITDQATGQSGFLFTTFTLSTHFLEGSSLTSATLDAFGSIQNGALASNGLVLGNSFYTASNFSFTPPSAPTSSGGTSDIDGAFSEHITAFNLGNVPEPGMVTFAVGMGICGSVLRLRRRK